MQRYFFNIHDGKSIIDEDGMYLVSLKQAKLMAVRIMGQLFEDEAEIFALGREWRMEVVDENGRILIRLDFSISDMSAEEPSGNK